MPKGRELRVLPEFYLLLPEPGKIVMARKLDCRVKRRVGLHIDLALHIATAGAPGDLSEQLECPLTAAKVRQMKPHIRIHDANECHIWEMQAFCDHLRADEDVDFASPEGVQRIPERVFARDGIRVEALHHGLREECAHEFLHFFRAGAGVFDARVGALGTF
jgi:hypothetical protein